MKKMENRQQMNESDTDKSSRMMKIYEKCNKHMKKGIMAAGVLIGVAFVLDICRCEYVWETEKLFSFDTGDIVAISVVIWTFMTSLFSYYMGKSNKRYYGIRLYESLKIDFDEAHISVEWPVCIVFGELLVLIIAAILKYKITLFFNIFLQFITMLYIFLVICIKTMQNSIFEQIAKKAAAGDYELLKKMIRSQSFADEEEKEALIKILKENVVKRIDQNLLDGEEPEQSEIIKKEREEVAGLTKCILDRKKDHVVVWEILRAWFMESDSSGYNSDAILAVHQGIMKAVFDELTYNDYKNCERLWKCMDDSRHKSLVLWVIVYNIYLQGKEGEQWRTVYSEDLKTKIPSLKCKDNAREALQYWKQLRDGKSEEFYQIYSHIFG